MSINNSNPCQIKELNLSCWGCCGREFKSKAEVERDLKINTKIFKKIKTPSTVKLLLFRDRLGHPDDLMPSGLCSNLIDFKDNCVACPLHKFANEIIPKNKFLAIHKKDLRKNHCDINYECITFKIWKKLSNKQKNEYIKFLSKKTFNHYEYSLKNHDGIIIEEFLNKKNIQIDF
ncbi:MAG: hypothetical protein KC589_06500 [Nanoarchaeota archaeon]|nr:hypothetical protein [Nanoarchaeota archaeon]MCA9496569.1 hypothetical protein [Nanoarchaeota archaeon]